MMERININKYSNFEGILLHLFFLLFFIQFIKVYTSSDGSVYIRAYYVLIPVALLLFRFNKKDSLFLDIPSLFLIVISLSSTYGIFVYGYKAGLAYLFFTVTSFLLGRFIYIKFGIKRTLDVIERVSKVFITLSLIRDFYTLPIFIGSIFDPRRSAMEDYYFITAGGPNIEATILSIMSALLINRPIGSVVLFLSIITSIAFQSRTGLSCSILVLTIRFLINNRENGFIKGVFMASLVVGIVSIFTVISGANIVIFERFIGIQQELQGTDQISTSFGRAALWEIASSLIAQNPLGYGPGGAIHYLKSDIGLYFDENNFHNIAIQFSVDSGIISGIAYAVFSLSIIVNSIRRRMSNPIDIAVLIYLLSGLVQWTGYDPMGWVFIGIYSAMSREFRTGIERERQ